MPNNRPIFDPIQVTANDPGVEFSLPEALSPTEMVTLLVTECAGVVHLVTTEGNETGVKIPEVVASDAGFLAGTYRLAEVQTMWAFAGSSTALTIVPVIEYI